VEAGKKAASVIIDLELKVIQNLSSNPKTASTASEIAGQIGQPQEIETVFKICEHLAANPDRRIEKSPAASPFEARYHRI